MEVQIKKSSSSPHFFRSRHSAPPPQRDQLLEMASLGKLASERADLRLFDIAAGGIQGGNVSGPALGAWRFLDPRFRCVLYQGDDAVALSFCRLLDMLSRVEPDASGRL